MADKNGNGAAAEPAKRSRKKLLITGVCCIGLAGGGYVLGGRTAAGSTAGTHGEGTAVTETTEAPAPEIGVVVDVPSMNVNLADGHYLRLALSLGVPDTVVVENVEEFPTAPAKDIVVATLSGATMADLSTTAGREATKAMLTEQIVAAYEGEVVEVFLTEFVMQ